MDLPCSKHKDSQIREEVDERREKEEKRDDKERRQAKQPTCCRATAGEVLPKSRYGRGTAAKVVLPESPLEAVGVVD